MSIRICYLDAEHAPVPRAAAELLGELESGSDADGVRRCRRRCATRELSQAEVAQGAGWDARAHGIDQDHGLDAGEKIDQPQPRAVSGHDLAAGRGRRREPSGRLEPRRIVCEWAPDADDAYHACSISSRRKCVEHEMHGS
jgi:hypothetical protein